MRQGLVPIGAECWLLKPCSGTKPVAEGIAGEAPKPANSGGNMDRSYMMTLCEDGLQQVKVTKIYKKNVKLMYTEDNPTLQYLDEVVTPPAPSNTTVKWSVRYLVEKGEDASMAATVHGDRT